MYIFGYVLCIFSWYCSQTLVEPVSSVDSEPEVEEGAGTGGTYLDPPRALPDLAAAADQPTNNYLKVYKHIYMYTSYKENTLKTM